MCAVKKRKKKTFVQLSTIESFINFPRMRMWLNGILDFLNQQNSFSLNTAVLLQFIFEPVFFFRFENSGIHGT